jgi:hypothetical protein
VEGTEELRGDQEKGMWIARFIFQEQGVDCRRDDERTSQFDERGSGGGVVVLDGIIGGNI